VQDSLSGGADVDTVLYTDSTSAVTVDLGNASDTDQSASGGHAMGDTIAGFENATGSSFGDALIGSIAANILKGALGNDTLSGFAGNDKLLGAKGTDSFHGGTGTDDCDAVAGETAVSCER
jgi:Ca2+-binding RTX toxin-like protein